LTVGSARSNDVVIDDAKVSRHHLRIEVSAGVLHVQDLDSKNGTAFRGSRITKGTLPPDGGILTIGDSTLVLSPEEEHDELGPSARTWCGRLVGQSRAMRMLFAQLERIAPTSATVLVRGETGVGKELAAEALHELSARADKPFVVVDCGAIPRELIESELFGHVKGAFTGAVGDRRGAFEQASGGTIFLDEIGDLPAELQPRLLRVLETGKMKPVGSERWQRQDVRVVAATHRDLNAAVKEGAFREDLFYRLSVVTLTVPPLRERMEDLPLLCERLLADMAAPPLTPAALATLNAYVWPGNVRQLRNVLERGAALSGGRPIQIRPQDLAEPATCVSPSHLYTLPYRQAKEELLGRFTREYLEALLSRNGGNVSAASRESGIDRNWIIALARRHGVRVRD
jgi:DNA-binding NtrC family response regulator